MNLFDSSKRICFNPFCEKPETIQKLLAIALPVQDRDIATLDPIYIMNVIDASPQYRSLIWTRTGNVFGSMRTTHWVAETIFERMGFRYETWSSFWQELNGTACPMLPYVNGRSVFLKVTRGNKQTDWMNLSHCVSMDLCASLARGQATHSTLTFYFRLREMESVCLGIQLPQQAIAFNRQFTLAIQLREAWQSYYKRLIAQHLPKGYIHTCDEWQERFALMSARANKGAMIDPAIVEMFLLYQTICHYVERGNTELQQEVSRLLKKKALDHPTLHALWNQYRRDSDQDDNLQ